MKLFASLTSPYARKIRIMLAEKALPFELVVDSPWETNTRVPDLNPLGKVPVLITNAGEAFFDSPVVAGYLETLDAAPRLLPLDPLERVRVRQIEALADGVCDAAVSALLESRRPENVRNTGDIARQLGKVARALNALESRLGESPWFNGDAPLLGDLATGVALAYLDLRFPDLDWRTGRPHLAALGERLNARASFATTVPPAG